ncbi:2Fe-2S iron-sulfur cluster-binding protein [Niveispirillum sp.]|uniref:2Fe-2S iron-sulfur cluster-binding protein n=1 Tax=Niveispirillum TaxID=1543704 RepID=UPI001B45975D|nr:2Fe-2S iron-sulfur cluster-binding protein [Niveispirillum sp.]MBP7335942.1 2Fe-2S iron-sulfur cluster binding domain-containing protein [Niveispirillum sp.]
MAVLNVRTRDGQIHQVEAEAGVSIMESIRASGIDELLALCGGCLSCATCHVFVDEEFAALLPGPGEEESDLLESADNRKANSRLACQVMFGDGMDGLTVTIAPDS